MKMTSSRGKYATIYHNRSYLLLFWKRKLPFEISCEFHVNE